MENEKTKKPSVFSGLFRMVKKEAARRREERGALLLDIAVFLTALFFTRQHIAFSAHPLGAALVGVLRKRVFIALLGALFGAFSLGESGVIYAMIAVLTVLVRVLISGAGDGRGELFSEPFVMRVAAVAIGAFLGAIYEVLVNYFALSSILFGCFGVIISVLLGFAFYGVAEAKIHMRDLLGGAVFTRPMTNAERAGLVTFQGSFLILAFFLTLSLDAYSFFGISLSYIFVTAITLFVARRFGAVRAMAVGFVSSVCISATAAVGFALVGAVGGLLFSVGLGYAIFGGAAALAAWCAYAGGADVFLSTVPEYVVSSVLMLPFLKSSIPEKSIKRPAQSLSEAADLAAAKLSVGEGTPDLETALKLGAVAIRDYGKGGAKGDFGEYRNVVIAATAHINPTPCEENIDILATKLYKGAALTPGEVVALVGGEDGEGLLLSIKTAAAAYERECYELQRVEGLSREYELIAKMISNIKYRASGAEKASEDKAAVITSVLAALEITGCVRVLGEPSEKIVISLSPTDTPACELVSRIGEALGYPLALLSDEVIDVGRIIVAEREKTLKAECGVASSASRRSGISGDSAMYFERGGVLYAALSDGMGTGAVAERTSRFTLEFFRALISREISAELIADVVNHVIRYRGEECSATADIAEINLFGSEVEFVKCGAAASYVKRKDRITRILAPTAPLGIVKNADAHRAHTDLGDGDYVVMLSDGAGAIPDEMSWLTAHLSRPTSLSAKDYAEEILSLARKNAGDEDDITVLVIKISKNREGT